MALSAGPALRRLVALTVAAGVMLQALLGVPLTVRMQAEAATICSAAHAADRDAPTVPMHDHAHCLACSSALTPPLIPGGPVLTRIIAVTAVMPVAVAWLPVPRRFHLGFASRAPPASA